MVIRLLSLQDSCLTRPYQIYYVRALHILSLESLELLFTMWESLWLTLSTRNSFIISMSSYFYYLLKVYLKEWLGLIIIGNECHLPLDYVWPLESQVLYNSFNLTYLFAWSLHIFKNFITYNCIFLTLLLIIFLSYFYYILIILVSPDNIIITFFLFLLLS